MIILLTRWLQQRTLKNDSNIIIIIILFYILDLLKVIITLNHPRGRKGMCRIWVIGWSVIGKKTYNNSWAMLTEQELRSCSCWDYSPRLLLTMVLFVSNLQVPDWLFRYLVPLAPIDWSCHSAWERVCTELKAGYCFSNASIFRRLMHLVFLFCSNDCRQVFLCHPWDLCLWY